MRGWRRGGLGEGWSCLAAVLLLDVCLYCSVIPCARAQETTSEYRLKATYLVRIPDFVQWPTTVGARESGSSDSFRLCVVGDYRIGPLLAHEAWRSSGSGRRMEVYRISKDLEFKGCQIIFVSRSEKKNYEKILTAAKGINALTVGETDGFLDAGGIVELNFENDSLKFGVNLRAARSAQLKFDARLLAMAKRVIRDKPQAGT